MNLFKGYSCCMWKLHWIRLELKKKNHSLCWHLVRCVCAWPEVVGWTLWEVHTLGVIWSQTWQRLCQDGFQGRGVSGAVILIKCLQELGTETRCFRIIDHFCHHPWTKGSCNFLGSYKNHDKPAAVSTLLWSFHTVLLFIGEFFVGPMLSWACFWKSFEGI